MPGMTLHIGLIIMWKPPEAVSETRTQSSSYMGNNPRKHQYERAGGWRRETGKGKQPPKVSYQGSYHTGKREWGNASPGSHQEPEQTHRRGETASVFSMPSAISQELRATPRVVTAPGHSGPSCRWAK